MQDPNQPLQPQQPQPAGVSDGSLGAQWLIVVIPLIIIGGVIYLAVTAGQSNIDNAKVGSCLAEGGGTYSIDECQDQAVKLKVYGIGKKSREECIEVPGTSRTYVTYDRKPQWLCIGEKNVDLSTTVNDVRERECVVVRGSSAEKAACSTSGSRPVLKVRKKVSKGAVELEQQACAKDKLSQEVAGVDCSKRICPKDTTTTYSWGMEAQGPSAIKLNEWDRVLCLGDRA